MTFHERISSKLQMNSESITKCNHVISRLITQNTDTAKLKQEIIDSDYEAMTGSQSPVLILPVLTQPADTNLLIVSGVRCQYFVLRFGSLRNRGFRFGFAKPNRGVGLVSVFHSSFVLFFSSQRSTNALQRWLSACIIHFFRSTDSNRMCASESFAPLNLRTTRCYTKYFTYFF